MSTTSEVSLAELQSAVDTLRADRDALWAELTELKAAVAEETARRQRLASRLDNHELYPAAVRA